ncbi:TIGR01440 family protein [Alkalihalobacillus deserti]|uniref:TIGR01440 family protein n=1 Tax=Alkalihalobacillus deserti TaxID=2879466 RepID=UPI001D15986A|nr:TIGR01440 family protein [Alkalihalobacillus deserti]
MNLSIETTQVKRLIDDLNHAYKLTGETLLVIGTSTSEVAGSHIGSNGSHEIAEAIFGAFAEAQETTGVQLAFQCCEHLNRALVVERKTALSRGYEIVHAVPVRKAGGAMATYAFRTMKDPVLVESIEADVGIDIGNTLIGMHLKKVAVPLRSKVRMIGEAHVTLAITRPKLIGGVRAIYERTEEHE